MDSSSPWPTAWTRCRGPSPRPCRRARCGPERPSGGSAGTVLMRVFVGGAMQPELFELEDAALVSLVRRELADLLGAVGAPLLVEVSRHPRAMPQYTLGHLDRVAAIRLQAARHPRLLLT